MALEGDFMHYLQVIMQILQQAAGVNVENAEDEELVEYINTLRESILGAYTGIVQGLKGDDKQDAVVPYLDRMIEFIQRCVQDPTKTTEVLKAAIALVGDLVDCFGSRMSNILNQPFIGAMLMEGKQYDEMRQIATWTQKVHSFY